LKPTGLCTVLRNSKIADQKSCAAAKTAATGETAYLWPSGNKTTVGGTDEDFTVNGNLAAPNASDEFGLCLFVEKTGNTFCYKEGAKPGIATQTPAPAVTRAAAVAPHAPAPKAGDPSLEDEAALRKAAEEKVRALEAEIAQLKEAEAKRSETAKAAEAEAAKKAEEAEQAKKAAETKAAEILGEVDRLQNLCAKRDEKACEQALSLMNEAVVTGAVDTARRKELERLKRLANAPFGIPALSVLSGFPMSTWFASTLAALLGLALLITRGRNSKTVEPIYDPVLTTPKFDADLTLRPPPLPPQHALEPPSLAASSLPAKDALLAVSVSALSGPPQLPDSEALQPSALPPAGSATDSASPPTARTAYLLNMLLPGSGNAYFGQRAMSALLLIAIVLAITTPLAPDKSMFFGLGFSVITGIMAFFTAGESLLVGLPISLLLVLQPASAVVSTAVWLFSLGISQFLIRSGAKAKKI
jgi:uncharacterized Zn finger protein (UPF0148 family)